MEPLSPQDPIKHLLAQAREVEVRPNFSQNVLRAARQTPQDRGLLAALRAWWEENTTLGGLSLAGGALAALALGFFFMRGDAPTAQGTLAVQTPVSVEKTAAATPELPLNPESEAALEAPFDTAALLAVQDASQLTDSEISFLLY
jgi:hypothetical protein